MATSVLDLGTYASWLVCLFACFVSFVYLDVALFLFSHIKYISSSGSFLNSLKVE